jgi:hypothetical protein
MVSTATRTAGRVARSLIGDHNRDSENCDASWVPVQRRDTSRLETFTRLCLSIELRHVPRRLVLSGKEKH